jgi:hypothetical protein
MTKFTCQTKDCPAAGQVFEWDNADPGTVCRTCEQPMSYDKPAKAAKSKVADDE